MGLGGREDNMVTVNEIVLIIRPGGIIQTVIRLEQMSGSWIFFNLSTPFALTKVMTGLE